jgi:hypothetical protein
VKEGVELPNGHFLQAAAKLMPMADSKMSKNDDVSPKTPRILAILPL